MRCGGGAHNEGHKGQIGIDGVHRVERRTEAHEVSSMADFVRVARTDEVEPGQARLIDVKGTQIAPVQHQW
jgi:hypothetical protein